jgi:hypothetical protein
LGEFAYGIAQGVNIFTEMCFTIASKSGSMVPVTCSNSSFA